MPGDTGKHIPGGGALLLRSRELAAPHTCRSIVASILQLRKVPSPGLLLECLLCWEITRTQAALDCSPGAEEPHTLCPPPEENLKPVEATGQGHPADPPRSLYPISTHLPPLAHAGGLLRAALVSG